jgi:hypothetical protein
MPIQQSCCNLPVCEEIMTFPEMDVIYEGKGLPGDFPCS